MDLDLRESHNRALLIRRIIAGYLSYTDPSGRRLRILPLADDDLLEAEEVYSDVYSACLDEGIPDEAEYLHWMMELDFWDSQRENEFTEVYPKHFEHWCIKIFESVFKSETRERNRKYLNKAREEYSKLSGQRHQFYHLTAPGIAHFSRSVFSLRRGLSKFDLSYEPCSHHLFNSALASTLSDEVVRYLSRKGPWSEIWSSHKRVGGQLFQQPPTSLTSDQQRLVLWSSMYDNIRESPDCPQDGVIDDDDALDGWLIIQRRKHEGAKLSSEADKYVNNPKAGEIFIMAETDEDIKRIKSLNNPHGQAVIKSRFKTMKQKGRDVNDLDFADVRQEVQTQITQNFLRSRGK